MLPKILSNLFGKDSGLTTFSWVCLDQNLVYTPILGGSSGGRGDASMVGTISRMEEVQSGGYLDKNNDYFL